jgi:carboxylesterase type B
MVFWVFCSSTLTSITRYRYHGVFPNQALYSKSGAYHGSEIPLIFGTSTDTGVDTPDETKLAKNIQHAWATFAKDPDRGLSRLGWPVYQQNGTWILCS